MRRIVAAIALSVLAVVPWARIASADTLKGLTLSFAGQPTLQDAYALRTFGRVPQSDDDLRFTAPVLRGLSFEISPVTMPAIPLATAVVLPPAPHISLAFNREFSISDPYARYDSSVVAPAFGSTQALQAPPQQLVSSAPAFDMSSASNDVAFDGTPPAFASRLQDSVTSISTPVRVGSFSTTGQSERAQFGGNNAQENRLLATTTFRPRIDGHVIDVSVGSNYERLSNSSQLSSGLPSTQENFTSNSLSDLPGGGAAGVDPVSNDVTTLGVKAGVAVPVTHNLTFGMQYGQQRYTGSFGTAFQPTLDTSRYQYLGNVTFAIPRTSTAITLSAQQFRYQDNLVPSNTYSETRADLNFTVKF